MGMQEVVLDSDWTLVSSPDVVGQEVQIYVDGTGTVEAIVEVAEPVGAATGAVIPAGVNTILLPHGKQIYVRVTSGTASVYYSQFSGVVLNAADTGYCFSGDAGADEDAVLNSDPQIGFDDASTRGGTNPYEFLGYLRFEAAGLASTDTLHAAILSLRISQVKPGRTVRVYGLEYTSSQAGSITTFDDLTALTKTAAYADITTRAENVLQADITTIIEELQTVSGWSTTSLIQLFVEDTGSAPSGIDGRLIVDAGSQDTNVVILLASGGGFLPPEPP